MLKTKQVEKYTVSQYGSLPNVRRRFFADEVEPLRRKAKKGEQLSEDDTIYNAWLDEWTGFACLIQPKITLEEYEGIDANLYRTLTLAIEEVNSDGTEDAAPVMATSAQAKKKRSKTT